MEGFLQLVQQYGVIPFIVVFIAWMLWSMYKDRKVALERKAEADKESQRRKDEKDREAEREKREAERDERLFDMISRVTCGVTHTTKEQNEDVKLYSLIQTELDLLVSNGAQHAYFFLFHNGGTDILGRGMLKMTIQVESSVDGKPRLSNLQAVPRSLYPGLYQKLVDNGDYYIGNIEDIKDEDIKTYAFVKDSGSMSAFFKAVKRSDGLVIGFVGAEYKDAKETFDTEKKAVSHTADRVAGAFLMNEENKKAEEGR